MQPRLLSLSTAVPRHVIDRQAVTAFARRWYGADIARLLPIYDNAGIDTRRSCVPLDWYERPHGWAERSRLFLEHAVDLAVEAASAALARAGIAPAAIDGVVTVTSSGVCTPSLDALMLDRMGFRRDVLRLPVFGLGCAGGVLGLARAAQLAKAEPTSRILLVVVELCGLTFRAGDTSKSNVIATALFGDGAAAAVIGGGGSGPRLAAWGEHCWPDSLDVMGWHVEDDGLGVLFSRDIPALVRDHFRPALDAWLATREQTVADLAGVLLHPGGAKVVVALEESLGLPPDSLVHERAVLRDYGNMSAATLLFVIARGLAAGPLPGLTLASALGPGFTAGFLLMEPG